MLPFPNRPALWRGLDSRTRRRASAAPWRAILAALLVFPLPAFAQQATPDTQVGDTVTHPVTGEDATVVEILPGYGVITDAGDVLLVYFTVGDSFTPPGATEPLTITAVTTDPDTELVASITVDTEPPETLQVAEPVDDQLAAWLQAQADAEGAPGTPGGISSVTPPAGNTNPYPAQLAEGDNGGDGRDGVGTNICVPNPFGDDWCTFLGVPATAGGDGDTPDNLVFTVGPSHGDIEIVSNDWDGIRAESVGGNGGQGGDEWGIDIDGARGGNGGAGGLINVTSNVDITTAGARSIGIFAQSRSGRAGAGGDGYGLVSNGGSGGRAGQGGSVTVTNNGAITTFGNGSHGVHAISTGGTAGTGGDGWGIVGSGGGSQHGGHGSTVRVVNNGSIVTQGAASHGILAQSIGGTGGDGGDGGGIVALGGSASVGGNGGLVEVTNNAGASIATYGDGSIGVLAQSIGGGGGSGGAAGGLAAFGGSGNGGGNGSTVRVTNAAGSSIDTGGDGAHAVLAQSIGGGGGAGGAAAGAIAVGDQAGGGGHAGVVNVTSSADIATAGADARGLFAQSIGGGGGSASGTSGAFTVGGQGGSGGNGNGVVVDNGGRIATLGVGSDAILAQSIGGGGGTGGAAGGLVALGGSGGSGGSAWTVSVDNSGRLTTAGHFARGILAQSIGGGGGTGGFAGGLLALGGTGGAAGNGYTVQVDNTGSITTAGRNASAIQAQSIGGGGGDGGTTGAEFLNLGGDGSSGGTSGTVTVSSNGNLLTIGDDSHGIFAQSIGGGGGNGASAPAASAFLGIAIGGDGASGGNGAAVNVTTTRRTVIVDGAPTLEDPLVTTRGDRSHGIYAQSIGGGGGNGGFAVQATAGTFLSAGIAIGGDGAGGGTGGNVTVDSAASIATHGVDSFGILAQSIGGGGGNGGFAIAGALQANPIGGGAISIGVGGQGGGGGTAGTVDLGFSGSVSTDGERATGVLAQSLGGGGGNGGFSIAAAGSISGIGDGAIGVGIGGNGAAGGDGQRVTAVVDGAVTTAGNDAVGVQFQSIGGGGGNGGFNITAGVSVAGIGSGAVNVGIGGNGDAGGAGALVDGDVYGSVATSGDDSGGIIMQSIGGGGGNGGFNISVAAAGAGIGSGSVGVGLGGNGAGGGIGGEVIAVVDATVTTAGADSDGVLLQSVGGGGGNGGFNITVPLNAAGIGNGTIGVGLGGQGAGGGEGGDVTATLAGAIHTAGLRSEGLVVQSVGGGGGNGGFSVSAGGAGAGIGSGSVTVGLGGAGAAGGIGGLVTASFDGTVWTEGAQAGGVLFQSVGGGGGNGGFSVTAAANGAGIGNGAVTVSLGGTGGPGGDGGDVNGQVFGAVTTLGAQSGGIVMQSVGGGGGDGGFNVNAALAGAGIGSGSVSVGIGGSGGVGGAGGDVTAVMGDVNDAARTATVHTAGAQAEGVLIQSVGGGGGNGGFDITAPVNVAGIGNGAVGVSLGGQGGAGNDGGSVTATFRGEIVTLGAQSEGFIAQSVGGGGGDGGFSVNAPVAGAGVGSGSVSVALGGSGGAGGAGGSVTASLLAGSTVTTTGEDSTGVLFQSVGGGGGNGGFTVSAAGNGAGVGNGGVSVGLGGAGGLGSQSGDVTGTVLGSAVTTQGQGSRGIVVQSVGGGGGTGGFNVTAALAGAGVGSGSVSVGMGGAGGDGGAGGSVTAIMGDADDSSLVTTVTTAGAKADGVLVQSVGGGGGDGGFDVTVAFNGAGVGNGSVGVSLGGAGGTGSHGGAVTATFRGDIVTLGEEAKGFVAQSVGGGGGDGGFSVNASGAGAGVGSGSVAVGLGGAGGAAGTGGAVVATLLDGSAVTTFGEDAIGVLIQSVGGGGGSGGFSVAAAVNGAGVGNGAVSVGIGGMAGDGAAGGTVEGTVHAEVVTEGARSDGVVVQSIGGGGGNGGFAVNLAGAGSGVGTGAVNVGIGGYGGDGGISSNTTATVTGSVITLGEDADGVLVQSVGGGGGSGGFNVALAGAGAGVGSGSIGVGIGGSGGEGGTGGAVNATVAADVHTVGNNSGGVIAQSIGGGGGDGGFNVSVSGSGAGVGSGGVAVGVGGSGASGGNASNVTASYTGTTVTEGIDATGVLFQTVGGGGGNGGFNVGVGGSGAGTGSGAVNVGVGGSGDFGGDAGDLLHGTVGTASARATIVTAGLRSDGIVMQSIGGGGGNGGFSVSVGGSGAGVGSGGVGVGIGGSGAGGGDGGEVQAFMDADVTTYGFDAEGVLVQSVGGGGGAAGFDVTVGGSGAGTGSGAGGASIGGTAGGGGDAGDVTATLAGNVVTLGDQSDGVTVQSIGGGGGSGGFSVGAGLSGAGTGSGAVAVGVGGSGGDGGLAGLVDARFEGTVHTDGADSVAVLFQSVGGGGGSGGFSAGGGISGAGTGSGGVGVGVGGSGGGGGAGGGVLGEVVGDVSTVGSGSSGVVAQSIGGGGGQGGLTVGGGISGAGTGSGAVSVGIGGSGGDGGDASFVDARFEGTAVTTGDDAAAVLFQSIGGGGGQGGISVAGAISGAGTGGGAVAVALGGSGGQGGAGSTVDGVVEGDVVTTGSGSSAVVVQSIGGGGGNGGIAVAGAVSGAGKGSGSVAVAIGGFGDVGGDAGDVTSAVTGDILSTGADSDAIVVQSLGGGGGNGGLSVAGAISGAGSGSGAGSVGVGGGGGGGGSAGTVESTVAGNVRTKGSGSGAVVVQSLGGGGGNGGINISGAISLARSGNAGVAVGVGGFGGDGGAASTVFSDINGTVVTEGNDAAGVLAQSLGGGGGNGGLNISGAVSASNSGGGAAAIGVGGFGGAGGNAAAVTSNATGDIFTFGDNSNGFMAQSLGGGGGNGGLNVSAAVSLAKSASGALGLGVGGFGGDGGDAGSVSSTLTGLVQTGGANSTGILLQSMGGGGGNGGVNVSGALSISLNSTGVGVGIGVGGFGGLGGNAADVTLAHTGNVMTAGASSGAVTAQSLGGGGGNGGINVAGGIAGSNQGNAFAVGLGVGGFGGGGGNAGDVAVSIDGSVVASGIESDEIVTVPAEMDGEEELVPEITRRIRSGGSHGVLAQSLGGSGGNGALNVSAGIALAKPGTGKSYGLSLGVGGFGGGGGDAGNVAVAVDSDGGIVSANGDDASAIAAQSIGGGGGNGGLNVSGGIAMDGTIAVGVGGFGGDGGLGGNVGVSSDTAILTAGNNSAGILAQSIGGGGGNGGINIAGGITPQTKDQGNAVSVVFGVGGFGGAADAAGDVAVLHAGAIETGGADAHGILAQSIGGGGGNGALNVSGNVSGKSKFAFAGGVGGHGGAGANAGEVSVVSEGNIYTRGAIPADGTALDVQATSGNGILAQSIGGGGGNGGMNISGVFALRGSPVSFGIGGFGSGGGDAGSVSVTHGVAGAAAGLIATSGEDSAGIVAQSIGGGGGNAGANFLGSVALGAGGTGGAGGPASLPDAKRCDGWDPRLIADNCVNWDKVIAELDKRKPSKDAKSTVAVQVAIGGRGGEAGHASAASVEHFGNIVTEGDRSEGIVAQSIGGGGGNAAVNIGMAYAGGGIGVNLAVGGAPGDGGTGSTVSVHHEGDITTSGYDAAGIFAQSIGGGGGDVATNLVRGTTTGGTISVTLGRIGGTGGAGGNVSLSSGGVVTTLGDRSFGLFAQSVGNGGGKSGSSSIALGKQGKKPKKPNPVGLTLALGLEGGAGGTAGTVDVSASGRVQTAGYDAHAIFAQSIGGGGGASVMEMTPEVTSSNLVLTHGGTGGTGGASGAVTVGNTAELLTLGDGSKGVFAQSIGGGGGASEMSVEGGWESGAGGAVIAIGGSGGTGATSGGVTVTNEGFVVTEGAKATGIHAQSIGGGGGNSELAFSGQVTAEKSGAMSLSLAIGGDGGTGGAAGQASVSNAGRIATLGDGAAGIEAQSIGGGGGNGDLEAELALDSESGSTQLGLTFGGTGGTGGTGGAVTVVNANTGVVTTEGAGAHGIFAQSIGGGGGNSSSKVSTSAIKGTQNFGLGFALGGSGGVGGTGGAVTVTNDGLIETRGAGAHGIFAESIGGGGGNGELHLLANIELSSLANPTGITPLLGLGATGGNGNDAGAVTVTNSGRIVTHGEAAHGIVAKSIGGGGGDATLAVGVGLTSGLDIGFEPEPQTEEVSEELEISAPLLNRLGGVGGEGGQGGEVTVVHTGDIVLWGEDSQAIVAQSVNGGGGSIRFGITGVTDLTGEAGFYFSLGAEDAQDSDASRVSVTSSGNVMMMADNSVGHALQSIGGGGGLLDFSLGMGETGSGGAGAAGGNLQQKARAAAAGSLPVELTLGGSGGQRNAGGDIETAHTGDIGSIGASSPAMLVQSIGGGGGRAMLDLDTGSDSSPELLLTLGAEGGTDLDGGNLAVSLTGDVATAGRHAHGLVFQSIGGGGGLASVSSSGNASFALGGTDGASGDGGNIALSVTGNLWTEGFMAHGVFLQSIGGGGGAVFTDGVNGAGVELGSANVGDGGAIAFTHDGNIQVLGDSAYGILAQSLGGGGGVVDAGFAGAAGGAGAGGTIELGVTGSVLATGDAATAIFVQSEGADGGGDITLELAGGHSYLGGAGGSGLELRGGNDNRVTNFGVIATLDEIDGTAILAGTSPVAGNESIFNFGTVVGSVRLGEGENLFRNEAGARFVTGTDVDLTGDAAGSHGTLRNLGTLDPGGAENLLDVQVDGDFVQAASGLSFAQYDLSRTSDTVQADRFNVSGQAVLDGTFELILDNPGFVKPGQYDDPLVTAGGGIAGSSGGTPELALAGVPNSIVANFELSYPNANEVMLSTDIDFAPQGLNRNQSSVGNYVNRIQLAGGSDSFAPLAANLFFTETLGGLQQSYDSLNPVMHAESLSHALFSGVRFGDQLMDCRQREGDYRLTGEDQCAWMRFGRRFLERDATAEHYAYEQDGLELSAGFQNEIGEGRHLGLGASFVRADAVSGPLAQGRSDLFQVGATLKQRVNDFLLSGTLTAGHGWFDNRRFISVPGLASGWAESDPDVDFLSVRGRISHDLVYENWYLRTMMGAGLNYLHLHDFVETGVAVVGVFVPERHSSYVSLRPAVEIGGEFRTGNGYLLRPYGRMGVMYLGAADSPQVAARFLGAPGGVDPFTVTAGMDRFYADVAFGMDVLAINGNVIRIEGSGQLGSHTRAYGLGINWSLGFE